MWLNKEKLNDVSIRQYRQQLLRSKPNHVVIDGLFDATKLEALLNQLQEPQRWATQKHTYDALYVDDSEWSSTTHDNRFVKRDIWLRNDASYSGLTEPHSNSADDFLLFLRSKPFMALLSRIFNVALTDLNVSEPNINTNYFRLGATDFVEQHADDSPGREVCMLLYLNKEWKNEAGGELIFLGEKQQSISISPTFNRCVLFDPSSTGSEHRVNPLTTEFSDAVRYNVTSWYWSK